MKFKRSGNIALHVLDYASALNFYKEKLDLPMENVSETEALAKMNSGLFYLAENKNWQGLVEEYLVEDVEAAKVKLEIEGCKVLKWEGAGKDCYMQDPFGMTFNLWEEKKSG